MITSGIVLFTILCTYFLSEQPVILLILLIFIAYAKHKIYPIKKELLWFVFICVGGAIVEVLLVNTGSAWSYSVSQFFGIPIWIPPFWGVAATTIVVMYEGLINKL